MFQEFLPGQEVTVDCFSCLENKVLFCGARRRERIRMGISVSTVEEQDAPELNKHAEVISERLKLSGAWFFQMKRDNVGKYRLLEVASRIAGSSSYYRMKGINFAALDLYQRQGKQVIVPEPNSPHLVIERSLDVVPIVDYTADQVYVDLDDCLLIGNQVNTHLLAFLYDAKNRNIPIKLVTRHQGNLSNSLKQFSLTEIFDEIFHLTKGELKSDYIEGKSPLFIDDSFSEISEVRAKSNALCLMPDMISTQYLL